jgi:predicted nucleic acid-binding Zn ribbon protein
VTPEPHEPVDPVGAATPEGAAAQDTPPDHQPDGLDLARAAARAAAASPGTPAKRRPPSSARRRTALGRLVAQHGWELDLKVQGVFGRWADLVGDEVAAHCTPESFADGRLVVRTDSTAWATQLKLLAPTVVRRLNEELGHGTVTLIDVLGPHLPTWTKGRLSSRDGRGPRDTYG